MADEGRSPPGSPSQLQEAIDTIVRSFGHPNTFSISYRFEDGQKRTIIDVSTGDEKVTYELIYDGQDADAEPELNSLDEDG